MTVRPNSPWLSLLPPRDEVRGGERLGRLIRRAVLLALVLAPLGWAIWVLWQRPYPRDSFVRPLYMFHDFIYLPLKGWLWTRFYPWSLIFWLTVAALILLRLASWFLDRSFIMKPHVTVLRRLLHMPGLYRSLAASVVAARRLRIGSELVEAVADSEWDAAWLEASRTPAPGACLHLAHLTRFQLMISRQRKMDEAAWLKALELWLQAWVTTVAAARGNEARFADAFAALGAAADLAHITDLERLPEPPVRSGPSDSATVYAAVLLARQVRQGIEWAQTRVRGAPAAGGQDPERIALDLVAASERRRQLAASAAAMLERRLTTWGRPLEHDRPPWPDSAPETLATAGKVARMLALQASLVSGDASLSLGYDETLDALRLMLNSAPADPQATARWRELVEDGPQASLRPTLFWDCNGPRLLAVRLSTEQAASGQENWAQLGQFDSHLLDERGRGLARARLDSERLAAGPLTTNAAWVVSHRVTDERSRRTFANRLLRLPFRRRIDLALAIVLAVGLGALITATVVGVTTAERKGAFEPPPARPLVDERILTNVRDNLGSAKLLDATSHSDGRIYISQDGGVLHVYSPLTRLWSTVQPFREDQPISRRFTLLRSGCGSEGANGKCSDPLSLWALGDDGSLARNLRGRWEIVVSNSSFVGRSGKPVENSAITAAAVSDDGNWLLLGTESEGIGVYDTRTRRWLPDAAAASANIAGTAVEAALWWRDAFWLSNGSGVTQVTVDERRATVSAQAVAGLGNRVLDMDADKDGALWVLDERACAVDGKVCLWLGRLTAPGAQPEAVVDQRNAYPGLSLADLGYVQQAGEQIVLAGKAGIYTYDLRLHAWQRLLDGDVSAVLPDADGRGFYFAAPRLVGSVRDAAIATRWTMPDEQVVQLVRGVDGDPLVFTSKQSLYRVKAGAPDAELVRAERGTATDPAQIQGAASFGDVVLLLGKDAAVLHNTRLRTYDDLPRDAVPNWLTAKGTRLLTNGDATYAIPPDKGQAGVRVLETARLGEPNYYIGGHIDKAPAIDVAGPVRSAWQWPGNGIGLIDDEGAVLNLAAGAARYATGAANPALAGGVLQDVADAGGWQVFLIDGHLWKYDLATRDWTSLNDPTATGESIARLARANGEVLIITSAGRLIKLDGTAYIGGHDVFPMPDAALSDAWPDAGGLYLAGDGKIALYDAAGRRVKTIWQPANSGPVDLRGVINGVPLAQIGNNATLGGNAIDEKAGPAVETSFDGTRIWTVRRSGSDLYLKGYTPAGESIGSPVCFFRRPAGGSVDRIYDARPLPGGEILLATNAGGKVYSPAGRTWYDVDATLDSVERIFALGSHLLLVRGNPLTGSPSIALAPASLNIPDSCSTDKVTTGSVNWTAVSAYSVDEARGSAAWIAKDGSVVSWSQGNLATVLEAAGDAPAGSGLRRLYDFSDLGYLLFSTGTGLVRYDLDRRTWAAVTLAGVDKPSAVDAVRDAGTAIVTAAATAGQYVGTLDIKQTSVQMAPVFQPSADRFDTAAGDLLDVQSRASTWTFVTTDRIKYLDPATRKWRVSDAYDRAADATFLDAGGRGVVTTNGGRTWWVAGSAGPTPSSFARYDVEPTDLAVALDPTGLLWRLTQHGEVMRCEAAGAAYACKRTAVPFLVQTADVKHAWDWNGTVLFETGQGLRQYDAQAGAEITLDSTVAGFRGVTAAFTLANRLVLINAQRDVLVFGTGKPSLITGVRDLRRDAAGDLWLLRQDGWWSLTKGALLNLEPVVPKGANDAAKDAARKAVRILMLGGANAAGIDAKGQTYRWENEALKPGPLLPADVKPEDVAGLSAASTGLWVVKPGEVLWVQPGSCEQPPAKGTPQPPAPCMRITARTAIPAGQVVTVSSQGDDLVVVDAGGGVHTVKRDDKGNLAVATKNDPGAVPQLPLDDVWASLSGGMAKLGDGQETYDPVVSLSAAGALFAVRAAGSQVKLADGGLLAGAATQPFSLPPALDARWLSWKRDTYSFNLQTASGMIDVPRDRMVVAGRLAFEDVESVVAASATSYFAANRYGIWTYSGGKTGYDAITEGRLLSLAVPIEAAHGGFVTGGQIVPAAPATAAIAAARTVSVSVGAASLSEDVVAGRVSGSVTVSGRSVNALAGKGFLWDANRRGLAHDGGDLLLQSDAGVGPAGQRLTTFDEGPSGLGQGAGKLVSNGDSRALLYDPAGSAWYQRSGGSWSPPAQDPFASRPLVNNGPWEWTLRNNSVDVTFKTAPPSFSWAPGRLAFDFDALRAAAGDSGKIVVDSAAWLEVGAPADLSALTAARGSGIASDRFTPVHDNGTVRLYNYAGGSAYEWNASGQKFGPALASDPAAGRQLGSMPRVRVYVQAGKLVKEIQVDDAGGGSLWLPLTFVAGRLPVDHVTAVKEFDSKVYVATAAGLASAAPGAYGLADVQALLSMQAALQPTLTPADMVGTPVARPGVLVANGPAGCFERSAGQPFTACASGAASGPWLQVTSSFWEWEADAGGKLRGRYREQAGALAGVAGDLTGGRLPHDRLTDVTMCAGETFALWGEHWVTVHSGSTLAIDTATKNFYFPDRKLGTLYCATNNYVLDQATVPAGVYLREAAGAVQAFDKGQWQPVTDAAVAGGVGELIDRPHAYYTDRLRLRAPASGKPWIFDRRTLGGAWQPLGWVENATASLSRISIDEWSLVFEKDDGLWAVTPAGLADFARSGKDVSLDPAGLHVIPGPASGGKLCAITDVQVDAGSVTVRCASDSSQVYAGAPGRGSDTGVFTAVSTDPFASGALIAGGGQPDWEWRWAGRTKGARGALEAMWRGEKLDLAGGQFAFDTLTSVALAKADVVEVATSTGGWYEAPRASVTIADVVRPELKLPSTIDLVRIGYDESNVERLCLRAVDDRGSWIMIGEQGPIPDLEDCPAYQGRDSQWLYGQGKAGFVAPALAAVGGVAQRSLHGGRFADDIVTGAPLPGPLADQAGYWVPTEAGVVRMDAQLKRNELYPPPFPGLAEGAPTSLVMADDVATYAGGADLYLLDATRRQALAGAVPVADGVLRELHPSRDGGYAATWNLEQGRRRSLLAAGMPLADAWVVDASTLPVFQRHQVDWGLPAGPLLAAVRNGQVQLAAGTRKPVVTDLSAEFAQLAGIVTQSRLLVIGAGELWDVNLGAGLKGATP